MRFSLLIALFLISCNADVNTVDPQASSSIENSKKDSFFIQEYNSTSRFADVKEAWVEYKWKNEASLFSKSKVRTTGVQLNIKVNDFKNPEFDENEYFITWEMVVPGIGTIGTGNGVYSLSINTGRVPDSVKIEVKKRVGDSYLVTDSFNLYRK
ncbi:MAG TPA: hypothetical protein VD993_11880 [Chitinophagaceae bacterium]|nr:hypothetical protein [Chitinophagaceae bacterium]